MNSTELTMKPLEWYEEIRVELKRNGLSVKQREPFMLAFAQAMHSGLLTNDRPVSRKQFESALNLRRTAEQQSSVALVVDSFLANRERMKQIARNNTETEQPSWLARLKARKSQPCYLVYTGDKDACIEGARHWAGVKARRNGNNGCWLLIVPNNAIQPMAETQAA